MKTIKIAKLLALFMIVVFYACSSDDTDEGGPDEGGNTVTKVQAAFKYSISESNPNILVLENTTQGEGEYKSEWDFGKGEAFVVDQPGLDMVEYDNAGEYRVRLIVTNSAGFTIAEEVIKVDSNGICLNNICGSDPGGDVASLKGAANGFAIGTAVQAGRLSGKYDEIMRADFNNLTAEYQMKMNIMYPSQGNYDFGPADEIVNYGLSNDMNIHGHALIWHNATPDWVENFSGTDAEFEAMVEDYITTTLTRYKGKVRSWDVVNEAIEDGSNELRNSVFRQKMGDNYIEKCYQFARNADPDVLLFYNDYNLTFDTGKQAAMFAIVDNLKAQGLIDGVGAQMHISYNGPTKEQIQSVVDGTVSRGLLMHFAELDIRANPEGDTNVSALSSQRAIAQSDKFKEVAEIYDAIPQANKFALTIWGIKDDESWLLDFWGVPDWPLLFDASFNPKEARQGFLEGLQ
ncbi:endo-1,4-beta-xylanase [Aquimarina sp. D1M17]|uniref:endo-1,4-beta-xylanase n=1 Tax=Aquimarina acroporae TaxID=2937283 RepID=UPI0020BFBD61|nr:endo-1,4-beta-xylanase [Aquimarina acroporae]MCK8521771.1 endo-1,4-beta-xylanase [Aquimarina acroporae]